MWVLFGGFQCYARMRMALYGRHFKTDDFKVLLIVVRVHFSKSTYDNWMRFLNS